MITGHNTDVEYAGRVYHVQTEDKGEANPTIETLVYSRGEILESRRTSYAEAIKSGRDEKIVVRLMEQQHRRMLREVGNGTYDPAGPKPFGYNIISNRTLDEVVLEWLIADRGGEGLAIAVEGEETFYEDSTPTVEVSVRASSSSSPVEGAAVKVRLVGRGTRPARLFEGKTGPQGTVRASLAIPRIDGPQGVLVFEVKHEARAAELSRPVLASP